MQPTLQKIKLAFPMDPSTLDPRKGADPQASTLHFMLYEGLTKMTKNSTHEKALANEITISDDHLTYTFHLKKTFWSDGHPVTAHDFYYSWSSMLSPQFPCPNAHLLYPIENAEKINNGELDPHSLGIRVEDDYTFIVTLKYPTHYFLDLISFCVFMPVPAHIAKDDPKWAEGNEKMPVTNGPFLLKKWKLHNLLMLEKNPTYWNKEEVKLEVISIDVISSELTALNLFKHGDLDILGSVFTPIPPEWFTKLKQEGVLKSSPIGATTFITFNTKRQPFNNINFRKALSLSIQKQEIIDHIIGLEDTLCIGPVPPILKGNQQLDNILIQDIPAAKDALNLALSETGYTLETLPTIVLSYNSNTIHRKIAQALQQWWKNSLGINVKLSESDPNTHMSKLIKNNYDIAQGHWIVQYNDQMNILDRFRSAKNPKNYSCWENKEFTEIINLSSQIKDNEERLKTLEKAERILADEVPVCGLYHWNHHYLQQDHVHDLFISPIGSVHFNETYVEK